MDERLLGTPFIALQRCQDLSKKMADCAAQSFRDGVAALSGCTPALEVSVKTCENQCDHYEDILGTYLVKLSAQQLSEEDSAKATMLLKAIGDFERISDHGVNLLESAQELQEKKLKFSDAAQKELAVLVEAVDAIIRMSFEAFSRGDLDEAYRVEPLEDVIDALKEQMRTRHILRLRN